MAGVDRVAGTAFEFAGFAAAKRAKSRSGARHIRYAEVGGICTLICSYLSYIGATYRYREMFEFHCSASNCAIGPMSTAKLAPSSLKPPSRISSRITAQNFIALNWYDLSTRNSPVSEPICLFQPARPELPTALNSGLFRSSGLLSRSMPIRTDSLY